METGMNAWQLMVKGGPLMWPLFICSLAAVTLFIEKLIYFSSVSTNVVALKRRVFECVRDNKLKDAIVICEQDHSPVAKIIKAGLIKAGTGSAEIKLSVEEAASFEVPKLERRLNALSVIAHASLLLGLLGTAVGMAQTFHAIELRSASMNPVTPGDLAGGSWQALLTTIFGLCVAIPAFLAHSYCASRVNDFVLKMERAAVELVSMLSNLSDATVSKE